MGDLSRFKLNSSEIQKMLDGGNGVDGQLRESANRVLSAAQSDASNYVVTGNYRAGLGIEETHTDRLVVRVVAKAPHSHLVEANHGTLARALDAAG